MYGNTFTNWLLMLLGYKCSVESCSAIFSKWSLLRRHVAVDHDNGKSQIMICSNI